MAQTGAGACMLKCASQGEGDISVEFQSQGSNLSGLEEGGNVGGMASKAEGTGISLVVQW